MRTLLALLLACFPLLATAAQHPNIVIILADDQGWGDLSVHGNKNLSTPSIDSLARDGAIFDRFFVCPVCAPTRAEFLTGRYYPRTGVRGVSKGQERLNIDEVTIADTFKSAGYATGAFGKWHNGSQHPYHPNARGFDEYRGFTSGHWGHYFDPVLEHNGEITRGVGYITDALTNHAIKFIERNKEKPFFCYLPYNIPHSPMQVPEKFWKKHASKDLAMRNRDPKLEDPPHLRAALAMCENIDWNVGRVLKKLEELKLAKNTIVIYFSDNGPNGWRWNGDMKGKKGSIDEGGVRVPCLMRWPGRIVPGTRIEHIAGAIDFLPTLTDLAGVPMISVKPIDGRSLKALLLGEKVAWSDRYLMSFRGARRKSGPQVSVRSQQHRLDPAGRLFDLSTDPGQRVDLAAERPEIVKEMKAASKKFVGELKGMIGADDRPFPIGGAALTHLPARDGQEQGAVKRSAKAPNCSYFTNWTNQDDRITWDTDVLRAGEYEVVIYYTCPEEDVGSTFEVSCKGATLKAKVRVAHDPPLYGAESDRTPNRGNESYVKDWRAMKVGTMKLAQGRGVFTLRALEIPGKQVMDVRLVILRRK
jgi:arylsulfatase A-like enzyme